MNKNGQMHTIEALLALMIIIGVVAFAARSAPGGGEMQAESSIDTQLVLYGNDFLRILDMERSDHKSWLYEQVDGTVNGSGWDGATNIVAEWQDTTLAESGVFCRVEIVNLTQAGSLHIVNENRTYGTAPESAVTVTKPVVLIDPIRVYEVRLTLWYG